MNYNDTTNITSGPVQLSTIRYVLFSIEMTMNIINIIFGSYLLFSFPLQRTIHVHYRFAIDVPSSYLKKRKRKKFCSSKALHKTENRIKFLSSKFQQLSEALNSKPYSQIFMILAHKKLQWIQNKIVLAIYNKKFRSIMAVLLFVTVVLCIDRAIIIVLQIFTTRLQDFLVCGF